MAKVEVGRYSSLVRRFLSMKGSEFVLPEMSPEISAVFVLESQRPDWFFLKNERLVGASAVSTSGASAGPTFRVRNPLGSGVIATIESIWFSHSDTRTTELNHVQVNAQLASANVDPVARDSRQLTVIGGTNSALLASLLTTGGAAGDRLWVGEVAANVVTRIELPIVLAPGFAIDLGSTNVGATTISAAIWWCERSLPALEA